MLEKARAWELGDEHARGPGFYWYPLEKKTEDNQWNPPKKSEKQEGNSQKNPIWINKIILSNVSELKEQKQKLF